MMQGRFMFAIGAAFLSFASEGLNGLVAAVVGQNAVGAQAGIIGMFVLIFTFLNLFSTMEPPKPKPKRRTHKTPKKGSQP